jgi:hypothetical protein
MSNGETVKAQRAAVQIGDLEVEGFMLPDGSYRMSQTQVAESVGKPEINARRFLDSKAIKALLGQGYTPDTIEIESSTGKRGQSRFNALPLDVVTAYWVNECFKGNRLALALVMALTTETITRRFDSAFGVERTEDERNQQLVQRIQSLQQDLDKLGEAYAIEDEVRNERDQFLRLLRDQGIDPYEPPESNE